MNRKLPIELLSKIHFLYWQIIVYCRLVSFKFTLTTSVFFLFYVRSAEWAAAFYCATKRLHIHTKRKKERG